MIYYSIIIDELKYKKARLKSSLRRT